MILKLLPIFLFLSLNLFGQSYDENKFKNKYNKLLSEIVEENWPKAYKLSSKIKSKINNDTSYTHENKVLNYILIYSTAGLLNQGKLNKDKALKQVENLKGETMIMPARPFNSDCFVNCTHFSKEKNKFFTGVNNSAGTQIFCFEYVKIENGISETEEQLTGKFIILEGKLAEIAVDGNIYPRFKLNFIEGNYSIYEQ